MPSWFCLRDAMKSKRKKATANHKQKRAQKRARRAEEADTRIAERERALQEQAERHQERRRQDAERAMFMKCAQLWHDGRDAEAHEAYLAAWERAKAKLRDGEARTLEAADTLFSKDLSFSFWFYEFLITLSDMVLVYPRYANTGIAICRDFLALLPDERGVMHYYVPLILGGYCYLADRDEEGACAFEDFIRATPNTRLGYVHWAKALEKSSKRRAPNLGAPGNRRADIHRAKHLLEKALTISSLFPSEISSDDYDLFEACTDEEIGTALHFDLADDNGKLAYLKSCPVHIWPADVEKLLLRALSEPQSESESESEQVERLDRQLAIELTRRLKFMDSEIVSALLDCIEDDAQPMSLRIAATGSLALALEHSGIEDQRRSSAMLSRLAVLNVDEALQELYFDADVPAELRRAALEASVRVPADLPDALPDAWYNAEVERAYASEDVAWRKSAILCMGYMPHWAQTVREALHGDDEAIRISAIYAARQSMPEESWDTIVAIARDAQASLPLRVAAMANMPFIDPEGTLVLLDQLEEDGDIADRDLRTAVSQARIAAEALRSSPCAVCGEHPDDE